MKLSYPFRRLIETHRSLPLFGQAVLLAAVLAAFHLSNHPALLIGEALLLTALCYLSPEAGLFLAVACIPAANIYKHVGADIYTPQEVIVVACTVAWAVRGFQGAGARSQETGGRSQGAGSRRQGSGVRGQDAVRRIQYLISNTCDLDWAILGLVAAALLSVLAAENLPAAQWSLRILVIEPALLYLLIRAGETGAHAAGGATADENNSLGPVSDRARPGMERGGPVGDRSQQTWAAIFRTGGRGVRLLRLADALVLGAVAVSLIGLYQYTFTAYVEAAEGVRRILSIYDSPNHLGLFLGRVIPILVATVAFAADRRRRIGYALALLPILAGLYLTFSRGAWLVGLPAGLLAIGLLAGRRTRIAVLALLGLALLALLPFAGTVRFASLLNLQEGTSFNRLLIWQGSLRMIAGHPLWGVGIGNFVYEYPRYMLPEAWREPVIYHAHNLLLDFWAMLGLPGLTALVALLVVFFRTGLRAYRRLADPDLQALTLGLLASMVVAVAHGLVDTGYLLTDLAFTFMLTLALMGLLEREGRGIPGVSSQ